MRPPPPTGTSTVRTSGSCSAISSPTVACPATMSAWSNGGTTASPSRTAMASAARWRSSEVRPASTTSPPHFFTPATFTAGAVSGITTTARTPTPARPAAASRTSWALTTLLFLLRRLRLRFRLCRSLLGFGGRPRGVFVVHVALTVVRHVFLHHPGHVHHQITRRHVHDLHAL